MQIREDNGGVLPVTRWSLVARAGGEPGQAKCQALAELLSLYTPALRAHLIACKRLPPQICDDLLQAFVAEKVLDRDIIARADSRIGKFRTFLLTSLDNFVWNQLRGERTYQRHRQALAATLEADRSTAASDPAYGAAFDAVLARGILTEALDMMRRQCDAAGQTAVWVIFDRRILAPLLRDEAPVAYEVLAKRLGLTSAKQASNLLVTAKRMYGRILRRIVGQYHIENEIGELKEILSQARA